MDKIKLVTLHQLPQSWACRRRRSARLMEKTRCTRGERKLLENTCKKAYGRGNAPSKELDAPYLEGR